MVTLASCFGPLVLDSLHLSLVERASLPRIRSLSFAPSLSPSTFSLSLPPSLPLLFSLSLSILPPPSLYPAPPAHLSELGGEALLVHVVLVHAHPDALGVDLDVLRQRVLPRERVRAP